MANITIKTARGRTKRIYGYPRALELRQQAYQVFIQVRKANPGESFAYICQSVANKLNLTKQRVCTIIKDDYEVKVWKKNGRKI